MTSIREAIRRLLSKNMVANRDAYALSFAVYWTRTVHEWTPEQRTQIVADLKGRFVDPEFERDGLHKKYTIKTIAGAYTGASLTALAGVLAAYGNDEDN